LSSLKGDNTEQVIRLGYQHLNGGIKDNSLELSASS
jgi:hypothetical protein